MNLSAFLSALFDIVKNDALKAALPVIQNYLANIAANPAPANVQVQSALLPAMLIAALPNLEASAVKDLAMLLQSQVTALVGVPATPAAQPSAIPAQNNSQSKIN